MSEETTTRKKNVQQDVEIAVLAKEVEHLGKSVDTLNATMSDKIKNLTDVVRSFIEIADKKVDRDTYLADKLAQGGELAKMQDRLKVVEDEHKTMAIRQEAIDSDRKKIWGFSQGGISLVISLLTMITLFASVLGIFK